MIIIFLNLLKDQKRWNRNWYGYERSKSWSSRNDVKGPASGPKIVGAWIGVDKKRPKISGGGIVVDMKGPKLGGGAGFVFKVGGAGHIFIKQYI